MVPKNKSSSEDLAAEISNLKIRLRRIESFILGMPSPEDFIDEKNSFEDNDELFEEAKKIVQQYDLASASLIQRRLAIGYARAARLLDLLEEKGIVSAGEGAAPREVLSKNKT